MNIFDKITIAKYRELGIELNRCPVCGKLCENINGFCSDKCFKILESKKMARLSGEAAPTISRLFRRRSR